MAFFTGCGGLADIIYYQLNPYLFKNNYWDLLEITKYSSGILNALAYYAGPYFLLIFSISYTDILKIRRKIILNLLLLLPIIPIFIRSSFYPVFHVREIELMFWGAPYFLISASLLTYATFSIKDQKIKRERFLVFILIAPNAIALYIANYIGPLVGINGYLLSILNDLIGMITLFAFIILAARFGIMGIRIKTSNFEQQMKTATLGTNLINHTIKNELAKIKLGVKNITSFIPPNPVTNENTELIDNAFSHIVNIISRIQEKTETIVLKEEVCCLADLIENAIQANKVLFQNRSIEIIRKVRPDIIFLCDKTHFREIFTNILKNSLEAIPVSENGRIIIETKQTKKQLILQISDNGPGIPKDILPNIFEPFFTTKHRTTNYGLGLSYCKNVLQKSGGILEVISKENDGTTILLKLPISKILSNYQTKSEPIH